MTAISPCPMATNITAIGFISKDIEQKRKVFLNGIYYTLGRAFAYTSLGLVFYFGAEQFEISRFFQTWGEKFIGPFLILIGILMLGVFNFNFSIFSGISQKMQQKTSWDFGSSFLLGVVFALAFCPYSGVLFFGMLIPLTVASSSGLYLPLVFAIATGFPVIIFAWLISFSFSKISPVYNGIKQFEKWFRLVVSIVFIVVGLYYIYLLII